MKSHLLSFLRAEQKLVLFAGNFGTDLNLVFAFLFTHDPLLYLLKPSACLLWTSRCNAGISNRNPHALGRSKVEHPNWLNYNRIDNPPHSRVNLKYK
jgi:hypothetical protein